MCLKQPTKGLEMSQFVMLLGNSMEVLKDLPENSVDSVVTDPPYGLKFMGKKWDYEVPTKELWSEVLRVLKPGGHVLSFGGTRTYHRMVVEIEDAGFEIRDQIMWLYGSGFPKSHDISKAIDKAAGAERTEVIGEKSSPDGRTNANRQGNGWVQAGFAENNKVENNTTLLAPAADAAKQWQGWGTALKPANEPIVLARKPLEKGLTIAENVLKWGVGAINIDASRIKTTDQDVLNAAQGRWPANLILDETAAGMLDEQTGELVGGNGKRTTKKQNSMGYSERDKPYDDFSYADSGGASRFFYCAKASKSERNAGLAGLAGLAVHRYGAGIGQGKNPKAPTIDKNHHPTVKPIRLMEYLIRLITPSGGTALDPFAGSGSTGVAAVRLGYQFIGIEMNEEYFKIAEKRITNGVKDDEAA